MGSQEKEEALIAAHPNNQSVPLQWQFVAIVILVVLLKVACGVYRGRQREQRKKMKPYRVVKSPQNVEEGKSDKRVVAVLGGTGFVGSHVVDQLLETGEYHVYMLGRTFKDDRVIPKVDALIQVDMMDFEGLCSAFQGVDTVVHSAVSLPTVYTPLDELWTVNKQGAENVVAAAQKCGVKNLVLVSGLQFKPSIKDRLTLVMLECFTAIERHIMEASVNSSLKTCVTRFGHMYGLRSPIFEMILKKEMSRMPLPEHPVSFTPVEFAADVVVKAEKKLAEGDEKVVGKVLEVSGCVSTIKDFLAISEWGLKVNHLPIVVLKTLAYINFYVAKVSGWAPMGAELIPSICSLFEIIEDDVDNTIVEEALGIGKVPDIKEGVKAMVEKFKRREELKKKK